MDQNELIKKIEFIQGLIENIYDSGTFVSESNREDYKYELAGALVSLEEVIEVIEGDDAYNHLLKQI